MTSPCTSHALHTHAALPTLHNPPMQTNNKNMAQDVGMVFIVVSFPSSLLGF